MSAAARAINVTSRCLCPISSRGGEKRALHIQSRLVGSRLSPLRDDWGPVTLSATQEKNQARGSGAASQRGGGRIFQQVLRGCQITL